MAPQNKPSAVSISSALVQGDRGGFLPLPFANGLSKALIARLEDVPYGFSGAQVTDLRANEIASTIEDALKADTPGRVIHFIGHAMRSAHDLHFVGADGNLSPPVNLWTRDASALLRAQDPTLSIPTLFVVDACYAGTAIFDQLHHFNDDPTVHRWVIAASGFERPAYDGQLTRAFGNVLDRLRTGKLDLAPNFPHIPFLTLAAEVRREVSRLAGYEAGQIVRNTPVEVDGIGVFPLFPNPDFVELRGYQPSAPLVPFLESLAFDVRHWRTRAAGAPDRTEDGAFAGRQPELEAIRDFIVAKPTPLLLVTGAPGSGKSAVLGLVVCNAHESLHETTRGLWASSEGHLPGVIPGLVAIHARRLGMQQIIDAIAEQLGFEGQYGPQDLIDKLLTLKSPPTIVVDALDEASPSSLSTNANTGISELLDGLILPILRTSRRDRKPAAILIIGSRKWVGQGELAAIFSDLGQIIDLDDVPSDRLRGEIGQYAERRLAMTKPRWTQAQIQGVALALADRLANVDAAQGFGAHFLCAVLFLAGLSEDHDAAPKAAIRRAAAAPLSLPDLLAADLQQRRDRGTLETLLLGVALARGAGVPATVLSEIADVLAETGPGRVSDEDQVLEAIRGPLAFYLRSATDTDGTTLYRLFHQGLADYLLESRPEALARFEGYVGRLVRTPRAAMQRPYFARHLIEHAREIDLARDQALTSQLWQSPDFLALADPSIARAQYPKPDSPGMQFWELFAWCEFGPDATTSERASTLSAMAARWGLRGVMDGLAEYYADSAWRPVWGSLYQRSASILQTGLDQVTRAGEMAVPGVGLISSRSLSPDGDFLVLGGVLGVVSVESLSDTKAAPSLFQVSQGYITSLNFSPDGSQVVIADSTGRARLVRFPDFREIASWQMPSYSDLSAVATDGLGVVVGYADGHVVVGVRSGSEMPTTALNTYSRVTALAVTSGLGRVYVATANGKVTLWDRTFTGVASLPSPFLMARDWETGERRPAITSMAMTPDERAMIAGSETGSFQRWDAQSGRPLGQPTRASVFPILSIARSRDGRSVVTIDENRELRRWDTFTNVRLGRTGPLSSAYTVILRDRILVITARGTSIVQAETGTNVRDLWGSSGQQGALSFLPRDLDGAQVAVATRNAFVVGTKFGRIEMWSEVVTQGERIWMHRQVASLEEEIVSLCATADRTNEGLLIALTRTGKVWQLDSRGSAQDGVVGFRTLLEDKGVVYGTKPDGSVYVRRQFGNWVRLIGPKLGRDVTSLTEASNGVTWFAAGGELFATPDMQPVAMNRPSEGVPVKLFTTPIGVIVVRSNGDIDHFDFRGEMLSPRLVTSFPCANASWDPNSSLLTLVGGEDVLVLRPTRGSGESQAARPPRQP